MAYLVVARRTGSGLLLTSDAAPGARVEVDEIDQAEDAARQMIGEHLGMAADGVGVRLRVVIEDPDPAAVYGSETLAGLDGGSPDRVA